MRQLKKSKILGKILTNGLCVMLAASALFSTSTVFAQAETKNANLITEETTNTIVSYQEVFEYYYSKLISNATVEIDIEDFIDLYYAQEKPINEFVDFIVETGVHNLTDDTLLTQEQTNVEEGIQTTASGLLQILSPDEDYILCGEIDNTEYTEGVYFQREPIYEAFDYDRLYDGDIIFENASSSATKHAAFLYNNDQPSAFGEYVQTIEAVASGVQYGFLDDERMVRFGVSIYRVYSSAGSGVVAKAKDFIAAQVGKDYSINFTTTHTDRNSSAWYCSELVYAAYYSAGVDVCSNSNFEFKPSSTPCLPVYLTQGAITWHVIPNYDYLQIAVNGFNSALWNSAYWKVTISNYNSKDVVVAYNSKMCNLDDAKNWSGLSEVKTVTIKANGYATVNIYQNFFATAVAVSFVSGSTRYVTYGSELSKSDYSMAVSYNTIQL